MEKKQKINCDISTCVNNNVEDCMCNLDSIKVGSQGGIKVENKEETICQNYKCC